MNKSEQHRVVAWRFAVGAPPNDVAAGRELGYERR